MSKNLFKITAEESLLFKSPLKQREGNWAELAFANTSGTVTRERKKMANS